jgi:2-dehydropantoate 2-reductase
MKVLIIGAGVTGCFTAARLMDKGVDVSLLARGDKAARLENEGLRMRDGMTGEDATVRINIVRAPGAKAFDVAMVFTQAQHRQSLTPMLRELRGHPTVWYLGNTTQGYDAFTEKLGRDRVLGGFPGVGGTWEGEVLVYADREKPGDKPFDRLIIGEAHPDAAAAADVLQKHLQQFGMNIERYVPIMAWHWSHIALILPLAGAVYRHDQDLDAVARDRALLKQTMRATAQGFAAIRRAGYPILPRGLNVMRWIPAALGAGKIAALLQSEFGRIALAAHAATARDEMHGFAMDVLALAGANAGADLREVLGAI